MRRLIPILGIVLVAVGAAVFFINRSAVPASTIHHPQYVNKPIAIAIPKSVFDKTKYSTAEPTSLWVIANKKHPLNPKEFTPKDLTYPKVPLRVPGNESMQLRQPAATALETMFADAKQAGLNLMLSSGYRSYSYQVSLYSGYVSAQGQKVADTQSARPGYSEHQTGLAADLEPASRKCEVEDCFAATPEGIWLKANAYKYGFILRYQAADQAVTGYKDEAWHYRFVGPELANELHNTDTTTLEAFFNVSGGDYL